MIAQVLNREFLLSAVHGTRDGLERELAMRDRRRAPGPLAEFSDGDLREVVARLEEIGERPEGLEATERPPEEPEGDVPPPKDDYAYVPRDPLISIVQSVIEDQVALRAPAGVIDQRHVEDRRSPGQHPAVTGRVLRDVPLGRTVTGRRLWGRFEVARPKFLSDPRWVLSGVVIAWNKLNAPAPFNPVPTGPIPIGGHARILLVGDWGSGLDRATAVAGKMREWLKHGAADGRELHVIHLGDVYYTGGEREYRENLLTAWPVDPAQDIGSFTLNGNHDMYQGAHHYFDTALSDGRFARQGGSSTFALRNDHWQLLGLDSAYEDAGLHGDQAAWARALIDSGGERRTVLLSHHQPFSAYEPGASTLRTKIAPVLATDKVAAWFWGHEHRCLVYRGAEHLPFASCIGHGGLPEYTSAGLATPYLDRAPLTYAYQEPYGDGWQPWIRFGFVAVDLDDDRMRLTYVDEFGHPHHTEDVP